MNKTELPLPAPHCNAHEDAGSYWPEMFSAFQMREYAAESVAAERERIVKRGEEYATNVLTGEGDKAPALRGFLLAVACGPNDLDQRRP